MAEKEFEDREVSRIRYNASGDQILNIFKNLTVAWYFDGLPITTQVSQEGNKRIVYGQMKNPGSNTMDSHCLGYIELIQVSRHEENPTEVRLVCSWPPVMSYWQELDKNLQEIFTVIYTFPAEKQANNNETRTPTIKTVQRAEAFRKIKIDHPDWNYEKVADKYNQVYGQDINGETVRNAYRAMDWDWERSDRIR